MITDPSFVLFNLLLNPFSEMFYFNYWLFQFYNFLLLLLKNLFYFFVKILFFLDVF